MATGGTSDVAARAAGADDGDISDAADEPPTPPPPSMPAGEGEAPAAPRQKPYADAKGVFAKLIKLLPLATDEEAATFERRARRFTRRLGPLSLGRLVDDRRRPILWYACDHCVEIKILRRVRAESSRRPPRHRRDACSMAWRCRFLAARPSQVGRVIAEK